MLTSQYKCYTVAPAPSPSPALQTLRTLQLANGSLIHFCRGSVLGFEGDALVNAANEGGVEGGGVDGAVNAAGGPELKRARSQLPLVAADVRIPTGSARSTPAFGSLKVRHVIHAVGPDYCALDAAQYARADLQLQSAYVAAVDAARHLKLRTIGSCLLSAGVCALAGWPLPGADTDACGGVQTSADKAWNEWVAAAQRLAD
jgi:O-acetyl-ADP-ribose deacetylase (regulator of RNase III)